MSINYAEIWEFSPEILLVESDKTCSRIACKYLSSAYCSVKCAEVHVEAIDKVFTGPGQFDLIFLDVVSKSTVDIIQMTDLIQTLDPHVPIVAMGSDWIRVLVGDILKRGVIDSLDKPFTQASITEMVKKHCQHLLK